MTPRGLFPATLFVLLAGSAVFFAGSVAAPAVLDAIGASQATGGWLTAAVQVGFVVGTMGAVLLDIPDRVPPRRSLAWLLIGAAAANGLLLTAGSLWQAIVWRFLAGALAGPIYPIGMRLLATWYANLGPRLGVLLGAYTLGAGTAAMLRALQAPHEGAVLGASVVALLGAGAAHFLIEGSRLPARPALDARAWMRSYAVPQYRWSSIAYFGHMWELFAFWGLLAFWLEAAGWTGTPRHALQAGVYVMGGLGCLWAGLRSRRTGAGRVARLALGGSGLLALSSPWWHDGILLAPLVLAWGWLVIADSPMFSAISAAAAPQEYVGAALTFQNSIGFLIPVVPLLLVPVAAEAWGWGAAFGLLAIGPILTWWATWRLSPQTS